MARLKLLNGLQFPDGSTQDSAPSTPAQRKGDFQWFYDDSSTVPTGIGSGDYRANNATLGLATEIYIGHGDFSGHGDPSVIFLDWETRGITGYMWLFGNSDLEWMLFRFTAVDDLSTYTKFTVVEVDDQNPMGSGEITWFKFDLDTVGAGGGGSVDLPYLWAMGAL